MTILYESYPIRYWGHELPLFYFSVLWTIHLCEFYHSYLFQQVKSWALVTILLSSELLQRNACLLGLNGVSIIYQILDFFLGSFSILLKFCSTIGLR